MIILAALQLNAQSTSDTTDPKPGNSRFMLRGYSDATFQSNDEESTFGNARFIPVFLY